MGANQPAAGDRVDSRSEWIEVHVPELNRLFNAMDPSPFRERDLAWDAEEFIVGWAREAPHSARLALRVHVDRSADPADEIVMLRDAIRAFFADRSRRTRQRLRQLFRVGRLSLLIGLVFLGLLIVLGDLVANALPGRRLGNILRESLLIGGWVAMWRPLEIFLYDWWPIRSEARLYDRLSAMPVEIASVPAPGPITPSPAGSSPSPSRA